jgi:hypothetical protein
VAEEDPFDELDPFDVPLLVELFDDEELFDPDPFELDELFDVDPELPEVPVPDPLELFEEEFEFCELDWLCDPEVPDPVDELPLLVVVLSPVPLWF